MVYTLKTPYRDETTQVAFNGAAIRRWISLRGWQHWPERGPIEVCARCGGSARVIVEASNRCVEDQDIIPDKAGQALDRILDHLRQKEQETPTRPLLLPRACYHAPGATEQSAA